MIPIYKVGGLFWDEESQTVRVTLIITTSEEFEFTFDMIPRDFVSYLTMSGRFRRGGKRYNDGGATDALVDAIAEEVIVDYQEIARAKRIQAYKDARGYGDKDLEGGALGFPDEDYY